MVVMGLPEQPSQRTTALVSGRFQQVLVQPPSVLDTIAILRGLKERYELYHGVRISDAALVQVRGPPGGVPFRVRLAFRAKKKVPKLKASCLGDRIFAFAWNETALLVSVAPYLHMSAPPPPDRGD